MYEQKHGTKEEFKLTLGERFMIMEQLERDGLTDLDSATAIKRAYKFLTELRSLQQNFTKKKPKRHLRATRKKQLDHGSSFESIKSAFSRDGNHDDTSDTESVSSTSSMGKRRSLSTKAKDGFNAWRAMRYGVDQANPLDDSSTDEGESTSPETAAYFSNRSKKKIGSASSDTAGAVASIATQVNIPAGVRAIRGQLRTNSHLGHLKGIMRDIKSKEQELLESGTASEEQLIKYDDLDYLCKQIISIKTAKSIDQGGVAASAFIPSIISAASKVVGGATKAVSSIYHRDPHVVAVIAQKLHAHAREEMKVWNASEEGCDVETPGLAIVCELFAHTNDPRPAIVQKKTILPNPNERIRLAETIVMESKGWSAIMDKLTLK